MNICERRYYLDKLDPDSFGGPAAQRGTHVHEAMEIMAKIMADGKTAEEALEIMKAELPKGYLPELELTGYLTRSLVAMRDLKPIRGQVERWFRNAGRLPMVGKIDLVSSVTPVFEFGQPAGNEPGPCVIDHKTTSKPEKVPSPEEAHRSLQLRLYCLATSTKSAAYIYHLPTGDCMGVSATFTAEELKETELEILQVIVEIEKKWAVGEKDPYMICDSPGRGLCRNPDDVSWGGCRHWEKCFGTK